jgi:hypothetical protein
MQPCSPPTTGRGWIMSSKPIVVGMSPLTGSIYAGTLLKDQRTWSKNRNDVTNMACGAVAEHVVKMGGVVEVSLNGEPVFEITVRDLRHD